MKVGDKVKVIRIGTNGHNYQPGKTYEICDNCGVGVFQLMDESNWIGNQINEIDLELSMITITELQKSLNKKKEELEIIEKQIEFIDKTKCDQFDDGFFISWYLLKLMNSTDKEKEKKMSRIINTISNNVNINILKNTF